MSNHWLSASYHYVVQADPCPDCGMVGVKVGTGDFVHIRVGRRLVNGAKKCKPSARGSA